MTTTEDRTTAANGTHADAPLTDAQRDALEAHNRDALAAQAAGWTDALVSAIAHNDLGRHMPAAMEAHWRAALVLSPLTDALAMRTAAVMALDCLLQLPADVWPELLSSLRADIVENDPRLELLTP